MQRMNTRLADTRPITFGYIGLIIQIFYEYNTNNCPLYLNVVFYKYEYVFYTVLTLHYN